MKCSNRGARALHAKGTDGGASVLVLFVPCANTTGAATQSATATNNAARSIFFVLLNLLLPSQMIGKLQALSQLIEWGSVNS